MPCNFFGKFCCVHIATSNPQWPPGRLRPGVFPPGRRRVRRRDVSRQRRRRLQCCRREWRPVAGWRELLFVKLFEPPKLGSQGRPCSFFAVSPISSFHSSCTVSLRGIGRTPRALVPPAPTPWSALEKKFFRKPRMPASKLFPRKMITAAAFHAFETHAASPRY